MNGRGPAARHTCTALATIHCAQGREGKPRTKRCPACRAPWMIETGWWGVFRWRGDGRYRLEDAVATRARRYDADRRAYGNRDLVVRFVADRVGAQQ